MQTEQTHELPGISGLEGELKEPRDRSESGAGAVEAAGHPESGTPEDVALLYSSAEMQGVRYRDFSASRREYRAQVRQQVIEQQREAALKARTAAEVAQAAVESRDMSEMAVAKRQAAWNAADTVEVEETRVRAWTSVASGPQPVVSSAPVEGMADRSLGPRLAAVTEGRRRPQGYRPDYRPDEVSPELTNSYDLSLTPEASRSGDLAGPAWLYAQQPSARPAQASSSVADTLQHSRERVASRWFALRGVFDQPGHDSSVFYKSGPEHLEETHPRSRELRTPVLAVFSLAGGVGKTSMVASLGRVLSALGEKVLLADTTSDGLLPYYFGARELRPGVVRTFSPPSGSIDAPISLVSYDVEHKAGDRLAQDHFAEAVANHGRGSSRLLFDINAQNGWIIRRLAAMNLTVLVPLGPDMNSVISLQAVERFFHGVTDQEGRALEPYYLLNQFDPSLPLHLDVREVLRRQLGDRLLPLVIRRAPAVSEALAEGMTVVDYAPEAHVTEDYMGVATWLRGVAPLAASGLRTARWSES